MIRLGFVSVFRFWQVLALGQSPKIRRSFARSVKLWPAARAGDWVGRKANGKLLSVTMCYFNLFHVISYTESFIPYLFRVLQCLDKGHQGFQVLVLHSSLTLVLSLCCMFSPRMLHLLSVHLLGHGQLESGYSSAMVVEHLKLSFCKQMMLLVLSCESICFSGLSLFHFLSDELEEQGLCQHSSHSSSPLIGPLRL